MSVHHLLIHYSYAAVFVLVTLESLGIPLPGETILVAAGVYAGTTHQLSIWEVAVAAAAGAVIGDNVGFWIGDKGGYRLLRRYGHHVRVDEAKVKVGRYIFDRHGAKVVFFGRFVSVLRTYAAFLAGTAKMRWQKFLVYNALGGIVWSAVYAFGAYTLGNTISGISRTVEIAAGVVAAAAVIGAVVIVRRHAHKLLDRAAAAYPGPLGDRPVRQGDERGG